MASNIFTPTDSTTIVQRINALNVDSPRKWGTMQIDEMLDHCSIQLKLALGIMEQEGSEGSFIMRTGYGRWLFLYILPWTRGLPTPSKMNMGKNGVSAQAFEMERKELLQLLDQVLQKKDLLPHPFFGELNQQDWGRLIWKHLDHHLRQFGG